MSSSRKTGKKVLKYLQFSTRRISFNQDTYVMLILDDLTDLILKEEFIREQKQMIQKLRRESLER